MDKVLWFALLIVFIAAEAATVGMVSTWFALGALAALVSGLLGAEFWLQIVLFVVVSGATLCLLRPIAKRYFNANRTNTNVDALVGKVCLVVSPIDNVNACGQVKVGDVEWSARSSTDEPIEAGTQVRVDRVEGVKVFVTPIEVKV